MPHEQEKCVNLTLMHKLDLINRLKHGLSVACMCDENGVQKPFPIFVKADTHYIYDAMCLAAKEWVELEAMRQCVCSLMAFYFCLKFPPLLSTVCHLLAMLL